MNLLNEPHNNTSNSINNNTYTQKIQSLIENNHILQAEVNAFNPKGFLNTIKKLFFGLNSFEEIKTLNDKIKSNNQKIIDIRVVIFQNIILVFEQRFIQKKDLLIVEPLGKKINQLLSDAKHPLLDSTKKNKDCILRILASLDTWRSKSNDAFIENEKKSFVNYFDSVEANPLTEMQKRAVITNEENNLILAGAGSGKTSVIIAKIGYILKKKYVNEDEILILAFNKKAQEELSERIEKKLNVSVDTRTFHSYGLKVIAEANNAKPSLCQWADDQGKLTGLIRNIITKQLVGNKKFNAAFTKYFVSYFQPYKSHEDFNNLGEYYNYIRNHDIKTLNNEKVKSYEECEIANQLLMWGIDYIYEADYKYPTRTIEYRQYKPDFYLPEYDIYIEHYGLSRDGKTAPYIDSVKYNEGKDWKTNIHKEHETNLIETFSYEKREGNLTEKLKEKLSQYDVKFREVTVEEALEIFNQGNKIDDFSKLLVTFMGHYQSNQCEIDQLFAKVKLDFRAKAFLNIFSVVNDGYLNEKRRSNCIDFNDMITEAVKASKNNQYQSKYKYILIDEFQDISAGRSRLISAIRKQVPNSNVTVVGDDWQSINRFAGSDISIIQNFSNIFGNSETVHLDYTFRFNSTVSDVATKFVLKNPKQISKTIRTIKNTDKPSLYVYWYKSSKEMDQYVYQIISLIARNDKSPDQKSIKLMGRYGFNRPSNLGSMQREYQDQFNITYSTVHGSKGLEADYIVLIGLESGKYGFPSEIEDDPLLNLVIPQSDDYPNAEERRLFYVALTRTKSKVFMIAHMYQKSNFINELLKDNETDIYELNYRGKDIESCPECKTGALIKRKGERHWFYGCSNYPLCEYTQKIKYCPTCKTNEVKKDLDKKIAFCEDENCNGYIKLCHKCNNYLVLRSGKYGDFLGCEGYPKCTYTEHIAIESIEIEVE